MKDTRIANSIKVGAVATAIPRWVVALLASEGFVLPDSWLIWWIPFSALASTAMAIVEGFAFLYLFNVWGGLHQSKRDRVLLALAGMAAFSFIGVLTPSIAASVRGVSVGDILTSDPWLFAWSVAVAASTISIVVAVGYAQRLASFPSETPELEPVRKVEGEVVDLQLPDGGNGYKPWDEMIKMEKAQWLHLHGPAMTQGEIAEYIGCSEGTVSRAVKRLEQKE